MEGVVSPSGDRRICLLWHIHVAGGFYKLVARITGTESSQLQQAPACIPDALSRCGSASVGWRFRVIAAQWCKQLPVFRRQHQRDVNFRRNYGCHCLETPR
jgi:hypothetical protein